MGTYICVDDGTTNQTKMDVARILVRTRYVMILNEINNIRIDRVLFSLKVVSILMDHSEFSCRRKRKSDRKIMNQNQCLVSGKVRGKKINLNYWRKMRLIFPFS